MLRGYRMMCRVNLIKPPFNVSHIAQLTAIESLKDNEFIDRSIKHNLYYHVIREGSGSNPTIADSIYVSYKGFLFNNKTFDSRFFILWFRFVII